MLRLKKSLQLTTNDSDGRYHFKLLLVTDVYFNIISSYEYNSNYYASNHTQLSRNLTIGIPSFIEQTDLSFSVTTDSEYDFTDEDLSILSSQRSDLSQFNGLTIISPTIERNNEYSFYISRNSDNYQYNISLNYRRENNHPIDIPWEVHSFTNSLEFDDNEDQDLPDGVTLNSQNFTISFSSTATSENRTFPLSIKTKITNYEFTINYNVNTTPCHSRWGVWNYGVCEREWEKEKGLKPNDDQSGCIFSDSTRFSLGIMDINITVLELKITIGVTTGLGFTTKMISGNTESDEWSILHMMQQVALLPLMAKFMTYQVKEFIVSNSFSTISIYALQKEINDMFRLNNELSSEEEHEYFRMFNWRYGSTFINNLLIFTILILLVFLDLFLNWIRSLTKDWNDWLHRTLRKLEGFFTCSIYIRVIYESYLFILLMAVFEIYDYHKEDRGNKASTIIAYILASALLLFFLLSIVSWCWNLKTLKIDENWYTREFYVGIWKLPEESSDDDKRNNKNTLNTEKVPDKIRIARLYPSLFLYRRTWMVFMLVFLTNFEIKIYSLIAMQVLRVNYSYWIRSFYFMRDQIREICNEVVYLVLMVLLTQYTEYDKWTKVATFIYIGIILSYTWILLTFSMIQFIKVILGLSLVK